MIWKVNDRKDSCMISKENQLYDLRLQIYDHTFLKWNILRSNIVYQRSRIFSAKIAHLQPRFWTFSFTWSYSFKMNGSVGLSVNDLILLIKVVFFVNITQSLKRVIIVFFSRFATGVILCFLFLWRNAASWRKSLIRKRSSKWYYSRHSWRL